MELTNTAVVSRSSGTLSNVGCSNKRLNEVKGYERGKCITQHVKVRSAGFLGARNEWIDIQEYYYEAACCSNECSQDDMERTWWMMIKD